MRQCVLYSRLCCINRGKNVSGGYSVAEGVWSAVTSPCVWQWGPYFIRILSKERSLNTLCCVVWPTIPVCPGLGGCLRTQELQFGNVPGKQEVNQTSCVRPGTMWHLMAKGLSKLSSLDGQMLVNNWRLASETKEQAGHCPTLRWVQAAGEPWVGGYASSPHAERALHPTGSCLLQFSTTSSLFVYRMCWTGCGSISWKEP